MPTAEELLRIAGQPDHPSRIKALPRYQQFIGDNLTPYGRKIFEEYAGIPSAEVEAHIYKVVSLIFPILHPFMSDATLQHYTAPPYRAKCLTPFYYHLMTDIEALPL
jgi:hypothetical protein